MSHVLGFAVDAIQRHRPQSTSYLECIKSIWYLHDETINIWTHLIAALVFLAISVRLWNGRKGKRVHQSCALHFYLPAATTFFLSSTLYHIFQNHIYVTLWHTLDHCSITLFMWASSRSNVTSSSSKRNIAVSSSNVCDSWLSDWPAGLCFLVASRFVL
jgi:predicted membrane channel-forming protein YqfA (hemolysin III family)